MEYIQCKKKMFFVKLRWFFLQIKSTNTKITWRCINFNIMKCSGLLYMYINENKQEHIAGMTILKLLRNI